MPKYEPLTAIAVCLALCQVELEMLRAGYGKDVQFDAFTIIPEPMKDDDIGQYEDSQEAQLARNALQLFRCLNDWLSIFWVSPVTPADIEEKVALLGHLSLEVERLSQDSTHAASRQ